jgi:peptidoglycan-associated lipoprotein
MKLAIRTSTRTTLIAATLVVLAACSSGTKLDEKAPVVDNSGTPATGANPNAVARVDAGTSSIDAQTAELSKRSIYFDFDSYIVKDEFRPVVEANSKFLNNNRGRKVIIQGNTDERGGSEYNLALGQKRAEAVRKQLALVGVPETQMEAVSLGKEKPRSTGHDEAAWAENRRADFVYQ